MVSGAYWGAGILLLLNVELKRKWKLLQSSVEGLGLGVSVANEEGNEQVGYRDYCRGLILDCRRHLFLISVRGHHIPPVCRTHRNCKHQNGPGSL